MYEELHFNDEFKSKLNSLFAFCDLQNFSLLENRLPNCCDYINKYLNYNKEIYFQVKKQDENFFLTEFASSCRFYLSASIYDELLKMVICKLQQNCYVTIDNKNFVNDKYYFKIIREKDEYVNGLKQIKLFKTLRIMFWNHKADIFFDTQKHLPCFHKLNLKKCEIEDVNFFDSKILLGNNLSLLIENKCAKNLIDKKSKLFDFLDGKFTAFEEALTLFDCYVPLYDALKKHSERIIPCTTKIVSPNFMHEKECVLENNCPVLLLNNPAYSIQNNINSYDITKIILANTCVDNAPCNKIVDMDKEVLEEILWNI